MDAISDVLRVVRLGGAVYEPMIAAGAIGSAPSFVHTLGTNQ